jgi:sigma-E factor negative regulatory protein RseA
MKCSGVVDGISVHRRSLSSGEAVMTDPVKEQLSACLDGELPEGELDLLLKQVSRDSHLRGSLGRYALIGETLRAQGAVPAPASFAERISAAVAAEPTLETVAASAPKRIAPASVRWLRPAAGFAVAAGVAAVAILALEPSQEVQDSPFVSEATSTTPIAQIDVPDSASYIVPANTATTGFVPAARLTNYVVAHSEYSTPLGRRSVLSGVLAEEESEDAADGSGQSPAEPESPESTDAAPQP